MIVDWHEVESVAGVDAILVSIHAYGYMRWDDEMIDEVIRCFVDSPSDISTVDRLRDEKKRREALDL